MIDERGPLLLRGLCCIDVPLVNGADLENRFANAETMNASLFRLHENRNEALAHRCLCPVPKKGLP